MKKALKTTFLYIGTAIGAGFSSGKEIALFFGKSSPLNVALSSVFMALLCFLFLTCGKLGLMPKNKLIKFLIFVSAGISLCSMLSGGEFVMRSMTGIPLLALVMAILGGIVVVMGIEKIRLANSLIVPLIVLSVALIFFKLDPQNYTVPFSLMKPLMYSGLDVLLGGVIVSKEGEEMTFKEIILSCIMIMACLFAMLYMLQTVVLADDFGSSMPVLAVSEKFNLKAVCGVLIAGAIFTTLVSSLKISSDYVYSVIDNMRHFTVKNDRLDVALCVFFMLVVAYPISFIGFDKIVDNAYPFISALGIILTAVITVKLILYCIRKLLRKGVLKREERRKQLILNGKK